MPFNINSWEILVILTLFILLFGPEKLPEVAIQIGRLLRELREATQAATEEITRELHSAAEDQREAAEDVRRIGDSARRILQDASDSVSASLSPAAAVAETKAAETKADDAGRSDQASAVDPPPESSDQESAGNSTAAASDADRPASAATDEDADLLLDGPDRMIPDEDR